MAEAQLVGGGPLDGETSDPTICPHCECGEVMDVVQEVYSGDDLIELHNYEYDHSDHCFHYQGKIDLEGLGL